MQLRLVDLGIDGLATVTLTVLPGECISIKGASGSGKTRLLRAIADLDPHGGEIYLDDMACSATSAPAWRRQVALLPAEIVWWKKTAREHFDGGSEVPTAALHLDDALLQRPLSELSTGQRQRLALLRLVQHSPEVLLLDEPTAALDPASEQRVEAFVEQYRNRYSAPVVWIGHDVEQLSRVAARHFVIHDGELSQKPPRSSASQ
ncbi:MAG: ATP-binding cassette domain-containing protein [Gammaproteobacteria bacterium]|nr:ATP-binding cassette domain-containing protein [Gammaproteobacteria bacterium]